MAYSMRWPTLRPYDRLYRTTLMTMLTLSSLDYLYDLGASAHNSIGFPLQHGPDHHSHHPQNQIDAHEKWKECETAFECAAREKHDALSVFKQIACVNIIICYSRTMECFYFCDLFRPLFLVDVDRILFQQKHSFLIDRADYYYTETIFIRKPIRLVCQLATHIRKKCSVCFSRIPN